MALEICRLCGGKENLKYVLGDGNEELVEQIRLCANVQINAFDCLPKHLCRECECELAFSYRLRKRSEATEKKLQQELLNNVKVDPTSERIANGSIQNELLHDIDNMLLNETHESGENVIIEDFKETEHEIETIQENEEYLLQTFEEVENGNSSFSENTESCLVEEDNTEPNEEAVVQEFEFEFEQFIDSTGGQIEKRKADFDCENCGKSFEKKNDYFEHIKMHGKNRFHCHVCNKWFSARYRYEQHIKNHNTLFECSNCNKTYTSEANMERHIRAAHNNEKNYQCYECGATFGRSDVLKSHFAKHSEERTHECDICKKKFKTSQTLYYHKRSHIESEKPKKSTKKTKPKTQIYLCNTCDKISHHRTTHLNHLRTHTGERPFKCENCDKAFRTSHARRNHMLIHTDDRPHECKFCNMSFRQTSHLKSHILVVHTGEKSHICHICQKAFAMRSNLKVHLRMHKGEMPYKCDQCPQKFLQVSQLKRHQMSHSVMLENIKNYSETNNEVKTCKSNEEQIDLGIEGIIVINQDSDNDIFVSECIVEEC